MYQISVEHEFDAAHFLRGYQGKCEAMHGHRYRVAVTLKASDVNDIGLAYDFSVLKQHLRGILARFDHTCLNDVSPFDKMNPSAENIATIIYHELKSKLTEAPASISCVEVWESPQSKVAYSPD